MEVGRIGQGRQFGQDLNNAGVENIPSIEKEAVLEKASVTVTGTKESSDGTIKEIDVEKAVDKLNKFLEDENVHAEYSIHDKLRDVMIKIVNSDTKEVILEIPPKKILDMVAKMCEMVGILVDKKA
jgi:flagellar protein FlaG